MGQYRLDTPFLNVQLHIDRDVNARRSGFQIQPLNRDPFERPIPSLRNILGARKSYAHPHPTACVYRILDSAWTQRTDGVSLRPDEGSVQADSRRTGFALQVESKARSGWILALRCGSESILVADTKLEDAKNAAIAREIELRQVYARDMPACKRVFTVDPRGVVVRENLETSRRRPITEPTRIISSEHHL